MECSTFENKNTRKRKNIKNIKKDKNIEFIEKIQNVDNFLELAENSEHNQQSLICRTNKDIFVSLSDISTDESDIEIVNVSKTKSLPGELSKTSPNDAIDNKQKFSAFLNKLDYLTKPPLCIIKQTKDYLRFDVCDKESDSYSSDSSSDSDIGEPIALDNGDCFIVDSNSVILTNSLCNENKTISDGATEKVKHKRKRKSQKRFPDNPELKTEPRMFKYWSQRYDLFERFDMGIKLDQESWFSVTPEYVAKEHAALCDENDIVLDGFCGAGGNTIQFAYRCQKVISLDIDNVKVKLTEHNCQVYGIDANKLTAMNEDYFSYCSLFDPKCPPNIILLPSINVVFLSPPWGGQDYLMTDESKAVFDLGSIDMARLMASARLLRPRLIIVYLPRNTSTDQLYQYVTATDTLDIIKHSSRYKNAGTNKVKAVTAIYRLH